MPAIRNYYVVSTGLRAGIYANKVDFDDAIKENPTAEFAIFTDLNAAMKFFGCAKEPKKSAKSTAARLNAKTPEPVASSSSGVPAAYGRGGSVSVVVDFGDPTPASPLSSKLSKVQLDADTEPFTFDGVRHPVAGTKSYYAVKIGKKGPGIYTKWMGAGQAYEQIVGFKNSNFKKFSDFNSARAFIKPDPTTENCKALVRIYPDGSHKNDLTGYGGIIVFPGGGTLEYKGKCIDDENTNQFAELRAILMGFVKLSPSADYCDGVKIVTDSDYSIKMMSLPVESGHKHLKLIIAIKEQIAVYKKYGKVVEFAHVESHQTNIQPGTDAAYNDIADRLADEGRLGK